MSAPVICNKKIATLTNFRYPFTPYVFVVSTVPYCLYAIFVLFII